MKNKPILLLLAIISILSCAVLTYADSTINPKELAIQAVSDNSNEAEIATKELRELGEKGLQTLFETYAVEIGNYKQTGAESEKWQRIAHALDMVAMMA